MRLQGESANLRDMQDLIPPDFHGWIGYAALTLMAIELVFVLCHREKGMTSNSMCIYAGLALVVWIVSYSLGFMKMGQ